MNNKLIFFCISSAILLFSILVFFLAPAINGLIPRKEWNDETCQYFTDTYNQLKKYNYGGPEEEIVKKEYKSYKDRCYQRKAMIGLEYSAFILNILFGIVCTFLGFLYFFDMLNINKIGNIIGLIGLVCGSIGFVLTFVYVIESGLVFNSAASPCTMCLAENGYQTFYNYRIDKNGHYLKYENGRYKCIFYEKNNMGSLYLRYSDYGNKYLGYYKNNFDFFDGSCTGNIPIDYENCNRREESSFSEPKINNCDNLFYEFEYTNIFSNPFKIIYDQWVATIIFSCFIFIFNIGLGVFGFLLFREANGAIGKPSIVIVSDSNKNI